MSEVEDKNLSGIDRNNNYIGPLMLDIEGVEIKAHEKKLLANRLVGGVILFTRNYQSRNQLLALVSEIRLLAPNILIAVDHEGGRVQRFRDGFTSIPAMATLGCIYKNKPEEAISRARDYGWVIAKELLACDIDISFAPVLDLDYGISSVIADRSFSSVIESVITLATAFIEGMHEGGMASTGKHFPGHGYVAADSHLDIPVDSRSLSEIQNKDMHIFSVLVEKGLNAVMPAHVIYPNVDDKPAGFSRVWLHDILRNIVGFEGVIFSDDLSMEGASVAGSFSDRAGAALNAGCDMILVCNQPAGALEVLQHLTHLQQSNMLKGLSCNSQRLQKMQRDKSQIIPFVQLKTNERWLRIQREINS